MTFTLPGENLAAPFLSPSAYREAWVWFVNQLATDEDRAWFSSFSEKEQVGVVAEACSAVLWTEVLETAPAPKSEAFLLGMTYCQIKGAYSQCPFPLHTQERRDWQDGWREMNGQLQAIWTQFKTL